MSPADVLREMLSQMNEGNWCQGGWDNGKGSKCETGWMMALAKNMDLHQATKKIVEQALLEMKVLDTQGEVIRELHHYNNTHGRKFDEIKRLNEKALEIANATS